MFIRIQRGHFEVFNFYRNHYFSVNGCDVNGRQSLQPDWLQIQRGLVQIKRFLRQKETPPGWHISHNNGLMREPKKRVLPNKRILLATFSANKKY